MSPQELHLMAADIHCIVAEAFCELYPHDLTLQAAHALFKQQRDQAQMNFTGELVLSTASSSQTAIPLSGLNTSA